MFRSPFKSPRRAPSQKSVRTVKPPDELIRAIQEKKTVRLDYDGHERLVEPHVCGNVKSGNTILVCYQYSGGSNSGRIPDWRSFQVAEITHLEVMGMTFEPRPDYNPRDPKFIRVHAKV